MQIGKSFESSWLEPARSDFLNFSPVLDWSVWVYFNYPEGDGMFSQICDTVFYLDRLWKGILLFPLC